MKIRTIEVDGFGVWSGLKVTHLDEGLNVVYGPNEAGKTTLLQFVRSILYGFAPERRHYLPPARGGEPGGALTLDCPQGEYIISRHDDGSDLPRGELSLLGPDGSRQGEHVLASLLANVDETIFNNVFAVSLQELQELATLSATEAADLLYRITAGLDRISVVEVMRELAASRQRILSSHGEPCQVAHLLAERAKLQADIEETINVGRRYGRLAADHQQIHRDIDRLEEDRAQLDRQARIAELALSVRDRWQQRAVLDQKLASLGHVEAVPARALTRLDSIRAKLRRYRQKIHALRKEKAHLQTEARELSVSEALWSQAPRIEALAEQQAWIKNLQQQIAALEQETAGLHSEMKSRREGLGLGDRKGSSDVPMVTRRVLSTLRPLASAASECRRQLQEAEQAMTAAQQTAESLEVQIQAAVSARGERSLTEALDRRGSEVAQYRRRLQIDERLAQMASTQAELEEQTREHFDRQLMPVWVLVGVGTVLMAGVILVVLGLMLPASIAGPSGWAMLILGLASGAGVIAFKIVADRASRQRFDACQKQILMLEAQTRQVKKERDALDQRMPRGGPIAGRLEKAEQQLASLEDLVPLDSQRQTALQETELAERRATQAKSDLAAARRRWQEALASAHLPKDLKPHDVRRLAQHSNYASEYRRRLEKAADELRQRHVELEGVTARIRQLLTDTGVKASSDRPLDQLQALVDALAHEQSRAQRRDTLLRDLRQVRQREGRLRSVIERQRQRRRQLLRRAGARNEQELRQLAEHSVQVETLRKQRESLQREIDAALVGQTSEEAIAQQLESEKAANLEAVRDELLMRIDTLERELAGRFEQRGRLTEQMSPWAEDRRLAEKQLEMAMLERRLADAAERWQVLATTNRILDSICGIYERERQPETLQDASIHLARLTQDRYSRVWTPLGERTLRVEEAGGNSLNVEVLSRGAREQLFLALRLALAASYARRGAALPLVLDDVLVNFDAQRAKAAATVLRDFAAQGHQVLVFTCHDHIFKLFKSLHVSAFTLPDNAQPGHTITVVEQPERKALEKERPADKEKEKEKEKKPSRRRAAKPPVQEEPEEEPDPEPDEDPWDDAFQEPPEEEEVEEYEWEEASDDDSEAA